MHAKTPTTLSPEPISSRRNCLLAALSAASLTACDKLGIGGSSKPQFAGIDITGADYAKGFELTDADGKVRKLSDFAGQVVVVFFGFVQCPDVCPTTLAEIAEAKKLLGANGSKLQGVFITLDPERDTAQVLKAYTPAFDPSFVALVPNLVQLPALAQDFKVYYKKVPGKTDTSYTMDHTAHGYVFDTKGRIRLVARYGMGAKALAADVAALLAQG